MFAEYLVKFSIDTVPVCYYITSHGNARCCQNVTLDVPFGNTVHFSSARHVCSRALTVSAHSYQLDTVYDGFIVGEAHRVSIWYTKIYLINTRKFHKYQYIYMTSSSPERLVLQV